MLFRSAQDNLFSGRHGSTPNYPIIESDEKNRLLFENVAFLNNNTPKLIYSTRFLKINNCTFTGNKQVFFNYSAEILLPIQHLPPTPQIQIHILV